MIVARNLAMVRCPYLMAQRWDAMRPDPDPTSRERLRVLVGGLRTVLDLPDPTDQGVHPNLQQTLYVTAHYSSRLREELP